MLPSSLLYLNIIPVEDPSRPGSPSPATKKKDAPASQPTRNTTKPAKGPASRGGRYYSRGGKPSRDSTQDNQEEAPAGDESAKKRGKCACLYFPDICVILSLH